MRQPLLPIKVLFLWLTALMLSFASLTVRAQEYNTGLLINPSHPPVSVRFMLTGQVDQKAGTAAGLLEVNLNDGWKTYWRTPGEGGVAPSIDWSKSGNLQSVDWQWPVPKRYPFLGVETLGYKDQALFPMTLHVKDINKPVKLRATLTLSTCTNVCVLTDYPIEMDFTPKQLQPDASAMHLYSQGISQIPMPSSSVKLEKALWDQKTETVSLVLTNPQGWKSPDIFVDTSADNFNETTFSPPEIDISGNQLTAQIKASSWIESPQLKNKTLSLVISDQNLAVALSAPLSQGMATSEEPMSWLFIIAVALLGGLILNVMPCVLPVLGMKLSSVMSVEGLEQRQIRYQFLASAAGILVSFWLLAGFLAILKLSGQTMGWGIQFQNPYFIAVMVLITGLFAANMLGLFEIQLSGNASTWLATRGNNALSGHFIQGMFATLLATPCSAPFLGTAVAFALAADLLTMVGIFTALAVGMALPWLLIAAFPGLSRLMPKPGRWMNTIKWIFGLMMLASSLWLLSLMANFLGMVVTLAVGVLGAAVLLVRIGQVKGRRSVVATLGVLCLSGAAIALFGLVSGKAVSPLPEELEWQVLDTQLIDESVKAGKTVFVDVTADWCITCKANKVGVLLQDPVYSGLQADNIVRMKGDWTKPSESVTQYLQAHGRYGVPFNIVYGPGAPKGIPLPVILTKEEVISAIAHASGKGESQ